MVVKRVVLAVTVLALASCGNDGSQLGTGGAGAFAPGTESTSTPELVTSGQLFGGLTIALVVPAEVPSGGELETKFNLSNTTAEGVTDPGCRLANSDHALIPAATPDAELWMRTMTDCSGPYTYEAGTRETFDGPTFLARTRTGEALAPGSYLAAWEVDGLRLSYKVEVTGG